MSPVTLRQEAPEDLRRHWTQAIFNHSNAHASDPFIACLPIVLDALKWRGTSRQLVEALPFDTEELTIEDFRDTLARLGFRTVPVGGHIARLSTRLMPCFYMGNDGSPYIVSDEDGHTSIFNGVKKTLEPLGKSAPRGKIYIIEPVKERDTISGGDRVDAWLREVIRHFRELLARSMVLSVLINILALSVPIAVMMIYDQVIGKEAKEMLPYIAGGVAIAIAFELMFRDLRARIQGYIGGRLDYMVGTEIFQHILHLPPIFTERAPVGGQAARLREFESLREFFTGSIATMVVDLPFVILFMAIIAYIAGWVVVVPLVLTVIYFLLAYILFPIIGERTKQAGKTRSQRYAFLMELMWWMRSIKQLGAEDIWADRFRKLSADTVMGNQRIAHLQNFSQNLSLTIMTAAGALTLVVGVYQAMDGAMSLGALIATMMLVWRTLAPLQTLFSLGHRMEQMLQSLNNLLTTLRFDREQEPGDAPSASIDFSGQIAFERVSMRYSSETNPALLGISFNVEPGELLAIAGNSGSGKTTIAKLVLGLYRPQAGAISLDGIDIRQLRPVSLRQTLAYVPQRNHAFPGSIYDNIALADPTASFNQIQDACAMAGLTRTIESLPQGFDTVFRDGMQVHVPQGFLRQVALARAFLRDAPVMILDEPASGLDDLDEQVFMKTLENLHGTRTIL
ncbi:MAG: ATP-binding cassette domain-containing protein, partial [Rhodospirillaceae bacterium]|nr:ATP-binding cassette domain-containing protein [Rhodospirillaceae bacterium]